MTFFGKEIPTDKINFVMNVVSFVLGVIFFVRMQFKFSGSESLVPVYNAQRDSLMVIETRLNTQVRELKTIQDSLVQTIKTQELSLVKQKQQIKGKRLAIYSTIRSDWDNLSKQDQDKYINKLISQLKPN